MNKIDTQQHSAPALQHGLIAEVRAELQEQYQRIELEYQTRNSALGMLRGRTRLVDRVLKRIWQQLGLSNKICLVAVGGYGRQELFPASDVDLLFLVPDNQETYLPDIEPLIGLLWDVRLDIGHSVRTIGQCIDEAKHDITVCTTLLDARLICGCRELFGRFQDEFNGQLDAAAFFKAKHLEQAERYARHNDTPYSLEPNCKESPGGLRDLQIILWLAQAAKLGLNWKALIASIQITRDEVRQLASAEQFLRHVRIHLHYLARRREDRLLFEYQESLAKSFGLSPTTGKRAAEILMQRYYRTAKLVTQLNTLVLQNLNAWLLPGPSPTPLIIDAQFQSVRDLLDIRDEKLFEREPRTLLESFVILAQRPELHGMTARTLRAMWRARRSARKLQNDDQSRELFLRLFRQRRGLTHELRRMNQYDILGNYLPAFGSIVGQMQHDLFHVYTVDQHILQVVRNLRRFALPEFAHEYPFCTRLMSELEHPWLLYIAALFHDIAKGRGGDHSKLGMIDARRFCRSHGLNDMQTELVSFLVEHHLTMSQVAQKQDLGDPETVRRFAAIVDNEVRLTMLYLLTVSDIRGTSPKVWNTWKGKLLEDLYRATVQLLRGDSLPQMAGVAERQEDARRQLRLYGLRPGIENALWRYLDTAYFLRHDAEEIAWHTRTLYHRYDGPEPIVRARLNPSGEGIQIMVYEADRQELFARICGFFARLGYTIVEAKLATTRHGYALDSFVLLDPGEHLSYRDVLMLIEHDLTERLRNASGLEPPPPVRLSRQVRHFPIAPEVSIRADERGNQFIMSIVAADRPGLLYSVAGILSRHGIQIHSAKISTLGERAEDTFLISGSELGKMASLVNLEQEILQALQI